MFKTSVSHPILYAAPVTVKEVDLRMQRSADASLLQPMQQFAQRLEEKRASQPMTIRLEGATHPPELNADIIVPQWDSVLKKLKLSLRSSRDARFSDNGVVKVSVSAEWVRNSLDKLANNPSANDIVRETQAGGQKIKEQLETLHIDVSDSLAKGLFEMLHGIDAILRQQAQEQTATRIR